MDNVSLFFQIFNLNGQSQILDQLMIFGTTHLIYIMFILVLLLTWKGEIKERKALLLIILGLPIAILLIKIIHIFFYESRPFVNFHFLPIVMEKADASFPSRHATIAAVIAFAYTYFKSSWAILFLPAMVWVGLSRIYVGVHYPLDIIGGFAVAGIALFICIIFKKIVFQTYFHP